MCSSRAVQELPYLHSETPFVPGRQPVNITPARGMLLIDAYDIGGLEGCSSPVFLSPAFMFLVISPQMIHVKLAW